MCIKFVRFKSFLFLAAKMSAAVTVCPIIPETFSAKVVTDIE